VVKWEQRRPCPPPKREQRPKKTEGREKSNRKQAEDFLVTNRPEADEARDEIPKELTKGTKKEKPECEQARPKKRAKKKKMVKEPHTGGGGGEPGMIGLKTTFR